jgi:hypothetical protein
MLLGDCLLWVVLVNYISRHNFVLYFATVKVVCCFDKTPFRLLFGRFLDTHIWSPCSDHFFFFFWGEEKKSQFSAIFATFRNLGEKLGSFVGQFHSLKAVRIISAVCWFSSRKRIELNYLFSRNNIKTEIKETKEI